MTMPGKGPPECRIEAENLSPSATRQLPIRLIIKKQNTYEVAEQLVCEKAP